MDEVRNAVAHGIEPAAGANQVGSEYPVAFLDWLRSVGDVWGLLRQRPLAYRAA